MYHSLVLYALPPPMPGGCSPSWWLNLKIEGLQGCVFEARQLYLCTQNNYKLKNA